MPSKALDEITYPFPNFKVCIYGIKEMISNFIQNLKYTWLLFPAGIIVNPRQQKGPLMVNISWCYYSAATAEVIWTNKTPNWDFLKR